MTTAAHNSVGDAVAGSTKHDVRHQLVLLSAPEPQGDSQRNARQADDQGYRPTSASPAPDAAVRSRASLSGAATSCARSVCDRGEADLDADPTRTKRRMPDSRGRSSPFSTATSTASSGTAQCLSVITGHEQRTNRSRRCGVPAKRPLAREAAFCRRGLESAPGAR